MVARAWQNKVEVSIHPEAEKYILDGTKNIRLLFTLPQKAPGGPVGPGPGVFLFNIQSIYYLDAVLCVFINAIFCSGWQVWISFFSALARTFGLARG